MLTDYSARRLRLATRRAQLDRALRDADAAVFATPDGDALLLLKNLDAYADLLELRHAVAKKLKGK